jgi:hypothetical protein
MKRGCIFALVLFGPLLVSSAFGQPSRPALPEVPGWKLTIEETIYKPDNLWDVIDGAADLFLEYNFVDLRLGRYMNVDSVEIKVELYRHATTLDAFGIYSQERYPDYHFLEVGVQGYREKGVLNFLAGPCYVKISSVQAGDKVQDGLLAIGHYVDSYLDLPKSLPGILQAFPKPGRITNSEQYIAKSFLGYGFLSGSYVVSYEEGEPFKSFVIDGENPGQAQNLLEKYLENIPKEGITKLSNGWLKLRDPHNGSIELGWKEKYLFGVYGDEKRTSRLSFLQELADNLGVLK